jgi:dTMP kinase
MGMRSAINVISNFIVLEGIDGSGTTTQLLRLAKKLEHQGTAHMITSEPTSGPIGEQIRAALAGTIVLHPHTIARLFAADRGEHLLGVNGILERTARNELVVCDRYLFSSLAYQGLTCGPELPELLNEGFPLPELLLFFEIDPEIAIQRVSNRSHKEIYETLDFQQQVAVAYRRVIASYEGLGMRIVHIDAAQSPDGIALQVAEALAQCQQATV